jgi:hypothetical protein
MTDTILVTSSTVMWVLQSIMVILYNDSRHNKYVPHHQRVEKRANSKAVVQSIYCVTGTLLGADFCNSGVFQRLAHFANSFIMTSSSFARVVKRYSTLGGISG